MKISPRANDYDMKWLYLENLFSGWSWKNFIGEKGVGCRLLEFRKFGSRRDCNVAFARQVNHESSPLLYARFAISEAMCCVLEMGNLSWLVGDAGRRYLKNSVVVLMK